MSDRPYTTACPKCGEVRYWNPVSMECLPCRQTDPVERLSARIAELEAENERLREALALCNRCRSRYLELGEEVSDE